MAAPAGAAAHGVGARPLGPGAQAVEFYYATGEPMAYATMRLFAPSDPAVPFLDGRADRLGRFAFLPSEPGAWTVEAGDGDGHTLRVSVDAGTAASAGPAPGGLFSGRRLVLWLSLSLNVFALAAWLRRRWPALVHAPAGAAPSLPGQGRGSDRRAG